MTRRVRLPRFTWPGAAVAVILATGCATKAGTPGSGCATSADCESGTKCLYAIGAGCDAGGHCGVASSECLQGTANLVLCGCGGAPIDLSCVSSSAVLERPTATGAACGVDAGDAE
jgi:hypothetical protein